MNYLILILLGIYNGLIIKWYNTKDSKIRTYWHIIGWVIRLLVIIQLPIKFIGFGIFISWSIYNILINIILVKPIYYTGTTVIDKYFNSYIQAIIDCILLIISILSIIFL